MQRFCLTFSRGPELQYVAHLDLLRMWQRALRRSGMPLVYSQGYSPSPRISLACPLPVGVTGQSELLEFQLRDSRPVSEVQQAIAVALPAGLVLVQLEEIPESLPSLASMVRWASYEVAVPADRSARDVAQAISRLMALASLPWQHQRETVTRSYDLRPLVLGLELAGSTEESHILHLRLRWDSRGAGRPEQVVAALGLPAPTRVHRLQVGQHQSAA